MILNPKWCKVRAGIEEFVAGIRTRSGDCNVHLAAHAQSQAVIKVLDDSVVCFEPTWFESIGEANGESSSRADLPSLDSTERDYALAHKRVQELIHALIPWRKGPFQIVGAAVDAEWRSELKWRRLRPSLPREAPERVLDLGCSNGYFLFRLAEHYCGGPLNVVCGASSITRTKSEHSAADVVELVGLDPNEQAFLQFAFMRAVLTGQGIESIPDLAASAANTSNPKLSGAILEAPVSVPLLGPRRGAEIKFHLGGDANLGELSMSFDLVLCLGVLYHVKSPFDLLTRIRDVMPAGGVLLLESIVVPGDPAGLPTAIIPQGRYAAMRNVYFIPSIEALAAIVQRCGFCAVEVVSDIKLSTEEQRTTEHAPGPSLREFLDPDNQDITIEGYPAPRRVIIRAVRRG